ncbi:MAG: hypothetical protein AB2807_11105 [Candidatus Sedimenticola endophacoides]
MRRGLMARLWAVLLLAPMIGGCAMQLVQPYDAKLVSGAEAFYKKAATMVQEGRAASPGSDPSAHPAHFSRFESRYDKLVIESEALILRAAAAELGERGADLHERIEQAIEGLLPGPCQALAAELGPGSLTVKNFVDLKCLVLEWRRQHADPTLTRASGILKQANWEARKRVLFQAVLSIQQAEGFKKGGS